MPFMGSPIYIPGTMNGDTISDRCCGSTAVSKTARPGSTPGSGASLRRTAMKVAIEIRPGEGGDDAKMLVSDQAALYAAYAKARGLSVQIEDDSAT